MSGRLYDTPGIPICQQCKGPCLTSGETNFNGPYCENCNKPASYLEYDVNHPIWIDYQKWLNQQYKLLIFDFDKLSFKNYKLKNGISFKKV